MKPEVRDAGGRRPHECSSSGPSSLHPASGGETSSPFVLETEHPLKALGEQRFLL